MNFSFIQQNYHPINGNKHDFVSSFLNYAGSFKATIKKPMLNYNTLKSTFAIKHFQKNVHPFFIHRYLKFSRFEESIDTLNNKFNIAFLSPYKWFDPYETLFYEPNLRIGNDSYQIACICCCYDDVESEESAWNRTKLTQNTDEKIVKLSFSLDGLCDSFEKYAVQTNQENNMDLNFYFSVVDYSQSKTQMITSNKPIFYKNVDEYINIMSLKRKAFAYENELRVFVVAKNSHDFFDKNGAVSISTPLTTLPLLKVTLPPKSPVLRTTPEYCLYSKLQDLENYALRCKIKKHFPNVSIYQSRLYQIGNNTSQWINTFVSNPTIW